MAFDQKDFDSKAMTMGAIIKVMLRKKYHIKAKINKPAKGAEIAICMNISTPKVSSAMGSPVIWNSSLLSSVSIIAFTSVAMRSGRHLPFGGIS